jgi:RimJ/RimL family protein N-acetyltransferase
MPPVAPPDPPLADGVVRVREIRAGDEAAMTEICNDETAARWIPLPVPYTERDFQIWWQQVRDDSAAGTSLGLLIADADDRAIGSIGIKELSTPGYGEIGYLLGAEHRGKGLATRALRLVRHWAAHALGLERIELLIHHENEASQHVARAAGFAETGEYRPCRRGGNPDTADHKVFAWPGAEEA